MASRFIQNNFLAVLFTPVVLIFSFKYAVKTTKGKILADKLSLKLPMFGPMLQKVAVARFARTLGTLMKSGVPILQALDICSKTAGNWVVEQAIIKSRTSIKEGESIATPLRQERIFPIMLVQMVAVGEETGTLDDMLVRAADFYDDEVDSLVDGLTAAMEPAIMVILGGMIGSVVIALFMPMFSMGGLAG